MKPIRVLWALMVVVGGASTVTGQDEAPSRDWPQWRGPDRTGVSKETGLLEKWPEQGPPLRWQAKGLGKGYSSIAIAGGRIYTMGDRGNAQYVIALDRATHEPAWATKVGGNWGDGGPRCTPTVDGDRVYALGTHGDLVCLDAKSGAVQWKKNLTKDFDGKMMSGWGYSESPLVDGEKVVCTPGGNEAALVALNKQTGKPIWQTRLPKFSSRGGDGAGYSSVVIGTVGGIRHYVQLLGRGVIGVAADDGRFLWGYDKVANGTANIATPIVHGNHVFATTAYNTGSALLELTPAPGKGVRADEVYFLPARDFQNKHGGVVLVDGYVYGGHAGGIPTCIELETGKVVWKERGPGGGSAAVAYADGQLYFRYENGIVALIEASPKALQINGQFKLPVSDGPGWAHPVILDGNLYLRQNDVLLCYDVKAGGTRAAAKRVGSTEAAD